MDTTTITSSVQSIFDKIPLVITIVRDFITNLNLPLSTLIIFYAISGILAFYWVKNLFRLSKLINFIILSILIFVVLTYVGVQI